jgi:hypothetical protein
MEKCLLMWMRRLRRRRSIEGRTGARTNVAIHAAARVGAALFPSRTLPATSSGAATTVTSRLPRPPPRGLARSRTNLGRAPASMGA